MRSECILEITAWSFQIDQDEIGVENGWQSPELDRSSWRDVAAPGAWDFYSRALRGYQGVGWLAATIPSVVFSEGMSHELRFSGVGGKATVFVDGLPAGQNNIRYLPFSVSIDRAENDRSDVSVVVRVDNRPSRDSLPGADKIEWVLFGGLIQRVDVLKHPIVRIEHVAIRAVPTQGGGTVDATATIANASDRPITGSLLCEIQGHPECRTKTDFRCDGAASVAVEVAVNPLGSVDLWDFDNPALYLLTTTLVLDEIEVHQRDDRFGFRSVETVGSEIRLNGRKIFLKGFSRYDDYSPYGPCPPRDVIRADLERIKKTGANIIRIHYPQDPVHLDIADEIGLLYMQEVPICWWRPEPGDTPEMHSALIAEANEALVRIFTRDGNHPSWIIWSMGNENNSFTPVGRQVMGELVSHARRLDKSRLMTWVCDVPPDADEFNGADLVGVNLYLGVFHGEGPAVGIGDFTELVEHPTRSVLERLARDYEDKPIIVSEFGTAGIDGLHGDIRFSSSYQAKMLEVMWDVITTSSGVAGGIMWCWADYAHQRDFVGDSDRGHLNGTYGPFGVVTEDRRRKDEPYKAVVQMFGGVDDGE